MDIASIFFYLKREKPRKLRGFSIIDIILVN
jgi:hypothetical protein